MSFSTSTSFSTILVARVQFRNKLNHSTSNFGKYDREIDNKTIIGIQGKNSPLQTKVTKIYNFARFIKISTKKDPLLLTFHCDKENRNLKLGLKRGDENFKMG